MAISAFWELVGYDSLVHREPTGLTRKSLVVGHPPFGKAHSSVSERALILYPEGGNGTFGYKMLEAM
jgi:hypothetical protein